ncbi:DUF4126 domain-containing protein [Microvirga rosea]|uniref:DUF4126 domain-containing protein n=1 Tax=Microvirga rosea TaxID=2715425 RepID=UPI001D0A3AC9|nr:DUF4126 domain-containing protein [Microvirga rosea]MCB8820752.1 DUF4126 domain-containing protein [Microvirga rosea]
MLLYLAALSIGIIGGLRAMTAPAAVSWGAYLGLLNLSSTWLSFLAHPVSPWIFTLLAIGELIADQLPSTPSRKASGAFITRIVVGGVCGAAVTMASGGNFLGGILAGAVGAVIGTLGGAAFRKHLALAFGKDRPAAFVEDAIAIVGAVLIVGAGS